MCLTYKKNLKKRKKIRTTISGACSEILVLKKAGLKKKDIRSLN